MQSNRLHLLPITLISKNGELTTADAITKDLIGFYFSAHWCPPCRTFTPLLVECYEKWENEEKPIEIIFISSDKDQSEFDDYFKSMPWLAIPYNADVSKNIRSHLAISGIPTLIIMDKNGNIIDGDADSTVQSLTVSAIDKWMK